MSKDMDNVEILLDEFKKLIEKRDDKSNKKIKRLITDMSQEEKDEAGLHIIREIIQRMETLDWAGIDTKKVRKRKKQDTSSFTEMTHPAAGYLKAFGLSFNTQTSWSYAGKLSGGLILATENKTVPPKTEAFIAENACALMRAILAEDDRQTETNIFTWTCALREGFVNARNGLSIDPVVKDALWFILDHVKDFRALS
jgi:hypothetical protein